MKYIRQFVIILFISFIGEALKYVLPLPIPASIYGLVLMFVLLEIPLDMISFLWQICKKNMVLM